jgi:nitroreductase
MLFTLKKNTSIKNMQVSDLNALIKKRRTVQPAVYAAENTISEADLLQILENARFAPTHKRTEPWQFTVIRGRALERLADFLVEDYLSNTVLEEQSEIRIKKLRQNPMRSACVVAIGMKRSPELLPEWEEVAAVAMAVQNMWLTAAAMGIGAYWSSPGVIERLPKFLGTEPDVRCLGLFYMGYSEAPLAEAVRKPMADKLVWLNE